MKKPQRKRIATNAGVSLAVLFIATLANAASIGTVTELDGNLLVARTNGSVKVLGVGSAIEQGDVLTSRSQTYVTLTLMDDSSVTLGPDTNVKVERYIFHKDTPDHDGALLGLAKGSVHITTGLLGTRDASTFALATPTSTIDMHGSSAVIEYIPSDRAQLAWHDTSPVDARQSYMMRASYSTDRGNGFVRMANTVQLATVFTPSAPAGPRAPGLYVQVLDGAILVTNSGGSQNITAGQFGFVSNIQQAPVIVPQNPGLQFAPPPSFSSGTPQPNSSPKGAVDCVVR